MWPRTATAEMHERARKRRMEGAIIFRLLQRELADAPKDLRSLEFGSGAGYHGEWLGRLGRCVLSDVYIDKDLRVGEMAGFLACDVTQSPFRSDSFDIIFSNHVVEHLMSPRDTFRELQRIGRDGCLYAFAVPTWLWLVLSVPAQYWDKARNVFERLSPAKRGLSPGDAAATYRTAIEGPGYSAGVLSRMLPHGHGCYRGFAECFRAFRTGSWRRHFEHHGFAVVAHYPVLCYAPAAWPIVPTNRVLARVGLCSSRLFMLRKQSSKARISRAMGADQDRPAPDVGWR